jgi:hypothetical protein
MENEFVPYQPSLDMKELGFDEPCFGYYNGQGNYIGEVDKMNSACNKLGMHGAYCTAPTYSQAFRWFRENHNLMFQIFYLRNGNYAVLIHRTTPEYMDLVDQIKPSSGCVAEVVDCYSYEEAELECLLKLIKIVKQQKQ